MEFHGCNKFHFITKTMKRNTPAAGKILQDSAEMDGDHCPDISADSRVLTPCFLTTFPLVSSDAFGQFLLHVSELDTRVKPTWLQRTSWLKTVGALRRAAASSRTRSHVVSSSVLFILRSGSRSCGVLHPPRCRSADFVPAVKLQRRWMINKEPPWRAVNG